MSGWPVTHGVADAFALQEHGWGPCFLACQLPLEHSDDLYVFENVTICCLDEVLLPPSPLMHPHLHVLSNWSTFLLSFSPQFISSLTPNASPPPAPTISPVLIERFRVEVLFSPGAAYPPVGEVQYAQDHVLPVVPRVQVQVR